MITRDEFDLAFYAAKGAYELESGGGFLRHLEYEFIEDGIWTIEETGLKAALYSDGGGRYVLSFAGTETAQDWYQNVSSMGFGQWDHSKNEIISKVQKIIDEEGGISSITIAGHSLGGALAQYAAYDLVKDGVLHSNQIDLVTFNGLGGASALKNKYKDFSNDLLADANIHHYFEPSDLIVRLSEHVGGPDKNYQLTSSNEAEFFLDVHSLETIEQRMSTGSVQVDIQGSHNYFNLDDILPLVQAFSSGTNGLLGGAEHDVSELEATARLFSVLPGITLIESFSLKPSEYTELRDWVLDNFVETVLGVSNSIERAVTVAGLGAAIGVTSAALNYSRLPAFIAVTSQLTASYLEYLYANNDQPDATSVAKDELTFSMFSILSGAQLNDDGLMSRGKISRVEVNSILNAGASHEANRYSNIFGPVAQILGVTVEDSLKGYIDFHHTLLEQGTSFSTVVDATRQSRSQLKSWLDYSGNYDLNGRLARYSVLNNLPFILMKPKSEGLISTEIRESGRYDKGDHSDAYWNDRLNFYQLSLSRNQNNLPYGEGLDHEYAIFEDLETGDIAKNYLFADKVNAYKFGTEGDDLSGLGGGVYHDNLYGLGGDDQLFGRGGKDTLEGGDGNDHLTGGTGDDYLLGDAGDDTYHFSDGHGFDIIEDIDGTNTIKFGDMEVSELRKVVGAEDSYKNINEADKRIYRVVAGGFEIISENGKDIVRVVAGSDFSRFGINVLEDESSPEPQPEDIVVGSGYDVDGKNKWNPNHAKVTSVEENIFYDASTYDAEHYSDDRADNDWEFWGGRGNDQLIGGIENDTLQGNHGHDGLKGGLGDDQLYGHTGNDALSGGEGIDVLVGGSGSDTLSGGTGADFLFGNGPYIDINAGTGEVTNSAGTDEGDRDIIEGGEGNDWISSGKYSDVLSGGSGEDQIFGAEGSDVIDGGADDDFIMGDSAGNRVRYTEPELGGDIRTYTILDHVDSLVNGLSYDDKISGGSGHDTLIGEIGNDTIEGGEGNDYIEGDKVNDSNRYGGDDGQYVSYKNEDNVERVIAADDYVEFQSEWSGNDAISGGAGQDTILGNGGDDTIDGGAGNDTLHGDDEFLSLALHGDDSIHGGTGSDLIHGGGGKDTLYGDEGIDEIFGDEGDDIIYGGSDTDYLKGGEGNDHLFGGTGDDEVIGGAGNDTLSGGEGADLLKGGDGNDTYVIKPGDGTIVIDDIQGINTIAFAGGLDASDTYAYTTGNSPASSNFIQINYGPNEHDVIALSQASYSYIREFQFSRGASVPTLIVHNSQGTEIGLDSDDRLVSEGDISSHFYGLGGLDVIHAGAGHDFVYGGEGKDTLNGESGSDYLYGGEGDDRIVGGEGDDNIFGGEGSDTYVYNLGDGSDFISTYDESEGRQDVLSFGESVAKENVYLTQSGDDLNVVLNNDDSIKIENFFKDNNEDYALTAIKFSDGTEWSLSEITERTGHSTPYHDYDIHGTEGDDVIDGLSGDDTIHGHEGNDQLFGSEGMDFLWGGEGNDNLQGGDANDELYGEGGDDVLVGGYGNDVLSGGEGNNIYRYAFDDGNDRIFGKVENTNDTIVFDSSIKPDDISVNLISGDMRISDNSLSIFINSSGDEILVNNFFHNDLNSQTSISFTFEYDGSTWSDSDIRQRSFLATEGNDLIYGTKHDDTINGYAGNDELYGQGGNDVLNGGSDADDLYGGNGHDNLNGSTGNDNLWGGSGNDILEGGSGNDGLYGENGDDELIGGEGDDPRLMGGMGNDTLDGGAGNDFLSAGLGDDVYIFGVGRGHDIVANYFQTGFDGDFEGLADQYQLDLDKIKIVGDLSASDIQLTRAQNTDPYAYKTHDALVITIKETGESLRVENFFTLSYEDTLSSDNIDLIEFDNGEVWGLQEIYNHLTNPLTESDDYVVLGDSSSGSNIDLLAGNDVAYGTKGDDTIYASQGDDYIFARHGNDRVYGGSEDDYLYGQDGDDYLSGGSGDDWLEAGAGSDTIDGGTGNDTILLNDTGNTFIYSKGDGHDRVLLSPDGANTLKLGSGISQSDINIRHRGSDIHISMGDVLSDSVITASEGFAKIEGEGFSLSDLNASGAFIDMHTNPSYLPGLDQDDGDTTGHYGNTIIRDWESGDVLAFWYEAHGTNDSDVIYGRNDSQRIDKIYGFHGDDYLIGQAGDDELYGGYGHDILIGGGGDDLLSGGSGNDVYRVNQSTGMTRITDTGADFNIIEFGSLLSSQNAELFQVDNDLYVEHQDHTTLISNYFDSTTAPAIDEIHFEDGTVWDSAYIANELGSAGDIEDDVIEGTDQADIIYGTSGDDWIEGYEGDDTLYGEGGFDILVGGLGNDSLYGGSGENYYDFHPGFGQDTIYNSSDDLNEICLYEIQESDITYFKQGNDLILSVVGSTDQVTVKNWYESSEHKVAVYSESYYFYHSIDYIESVARDNGADDGNERSSDPLTLVGTSAAETLEGGTNDDSLSGKGGQDTLYGYQGDDTLIGGGGADTLLGGDGSDKLKGGSGADHLYGGKGNDVLIGGKGNDTYHYRSGDGYDRINNASNSYQSEIDSLAMSGVNDIYDVWFKRTNNHLDISVQGSDDHIRVNNWYQEEKYSLDQIEAADHTIDAINIEQLVSTMAGFGSSSDATMSLTPEERHQLETSIVAAWS